MSTLTDHPRDNAKRVAVMLDMAYGFSGVSLTSAVDSDHPTAIELMSALNRASLAVLETLASDPDDADYPYAVTLLNNAVGEIVHHGSRDAFAAEVWSDYRENTGA